MKFISQYKGLPRGVYILCSARIITAMGMFIFSFTSLILTSILGFSEVLAGYVLMCSSLCGIAGAFLLGRLSDVLGRKKVLVAAMTVGAVNLFIGGLICRTPYVIGVILLSNFIFSGVLPTFAALVTDWSNESNRSQCFSLLYLCINVGFSVGQVFAGILFYNYYPWIFWGQGLGWLACMIIVVLFVKDEFVPEKARKAAGDRQTSETTLTSRRFRFLYMVAKDKTLLGFILTLILLVFCHTQISFMIPLQYKGVLGLEQCSLLISRLWLINGICCVVLTPFLSLLIRKWKPIKSMLAASASFVAAFGIYALSNNPTVYLALVPLWTCGEIIYNTTGGIFIGSRAPEAYRARYQSLNSFATSLGQCAGPMIMSHFLIGNSYLGGWLLVSLVSLAALFVISLVLRRENRLSSLSRDDNLKGKSCCSKC
ncbi:MAG: MFS transporter [Anaerovoracaceae bacterium]